ncbi:17-beta-hydroxysteroid dehydrogenase type 3 isoform X2 [Cynoglossus semilaevis]|uniref:17-beta-hydroxysteroid dehydrogenase type 3 isoform X2 n=1 Tax=Cynoglossus semilaevis TaxID=244447 RepID=UPI0007DC89CE|nr:testosterone 17-beta-dehydrogenase 3-like isoform X2 [Cynoglossus semilaevis]
MDLIEKFFVCLGAAVSIYCGMKLLLFSRMLFPKMWFPLPETFFTSMGEWAVVTGASEGVGKAYALALAERGMDVVIMSRTKAALDKVAKEIGERTGRRVKVIVTDFTKENIFSKIEVQLKDLNIGVLVNNVGMLPSLIPFRFLECPDLEKTILNVINCNMKTMVKMCKIILPGMENRRKGLMVNISSGTACIPFPMYTLYAASKVFVERFSQGLQAEYKDKGIIIQVVAPFGISTRMTGYIQTNAMTPSPDNFVQSSLLYLTAGDKTPGYCSVSPPRSCTQNQCYKAYRTMSRSCPRNQTLVQLDGSSLPLHHLYTPVFYLYCPPVVPISLMTSSFPLVSCNQSFPICLYMADTLVPADPGA